MPGLVTAEDLRTMFPFVIHTDIGDDRLTLSLASASARLKTWVSSENYSAAVDGLDDAPAKPNVTLVLQNAEGHLALHFALLGLNTQLRNFGIVKSEQVEGNTVNQYFSPNDTANFTMQYLEMAREIAEPYLLKDGTPSASFEIASCDA